MPTLKPKSPKTLSGLLTGDDHGLLIKIYWVRILIGALGFSDHFSLDKSVTIANPVNKSAI